MKKRIGVIIDTLDGQYQKELSNSLIKEASINDVQLVFFSGQAIHSHVVVNHQYDNIFDLPSADTLDGLFLIVSSLNNIYGEEWTKNLLKQYKSLPLVSLSIHIDEAINITHDNKQGMTEIINHMLKHVKLNEIAFVSGPVSNTEALSRLNAFRSYFDSENPLNEDYCFIGNFLNYSGGNAVDHFIESCEVMPKAIVCANDEMAIGAFLRLTELGYNVPGDILLSGYDNVNIARDIFPPFTTYDQGFYNMCKLSMNEMLAYIKGEREKSTKYSKGRLIIRESCGCSPIPYNLRKSNTYDLVEHNVSYEQGLKDFEEFVLSHIKEIEDIIKNHLLHYGQVKEICHRTSVKLAKGLVEDLKARTLDGKFIYSLNEFLRIILDQVDDPSYLQEFTQTLKNFWISNAYHGKLIIHIQELIYVAITIIEENVRRKQRQQQFKFSNMYLMSREMVLSLNAAITIKDISDILYSNLPLYGISEFYLCLFETMTNISGIATGELPKRSRLVLGANKGARLEEVGFNTLDLLPKEILKGNKTCHYLFLSLFSGNEQYGYMVLSMDGIDYLIYETLRAQVSEALKRDFITKSRIEAENKLKNALMELEISNKLLTNQSIHDELTGIYNRRGFFTTATSYFKATGMANKNFYVIFGDIDGLKYINDNYGHNEGDFAIKKITELIGKVLEEQSIFARMSGDEFIILIKNVLDDVPINALIKFIHYQLDTFNELNEKPYKLSISLGFTKYDPNRFDTLDQLILEADQNLYREKDTKKALKPSVREV